MSVCEGFQGMYLREIQELIDTTQKELTEDNLMQMNASEPVPDEKEVEEEVLEQTDIRQSGRKF